MNKIAIAASVLALAATSAAAGPFDQFKGKMKPGLYEMKIEMDMGQVPGAPPGMGKQVMTHQHCVTEQDIDKGTFGKGGRGDRMPESCEIKNMNMSGNTATYSVVCTQPKMTTDNKVTWTSTGYSMDMKMSMEQGGRMMNMSQHMEGKYLGACSK